MGGGLLSSGELRPRLGPMITPTLARALQQAGLTWRPANGDRFVITQQEMGDEVFHLADMTVEAKDLETGIILTFNGTTEWAMDSVAAEHTVWLPREAQLREHLGERFLGLERRPTHYAVRYAGPDRAPVEVTDPDAECAYARALLRVLGSR